MYSRDQAIRCQASTPGARDGGAPQRDPLCQYILSLPGMGKVGCAVFLGELGNPEYFKNPRQIIKYAGYDRRRTTRDYGWVGRSSRRRDAGSYESVSSLWCSDSYTGAPSSRHTMNTRRRALIVLSKNRGALRRDPQAHTSALCTDADRRMFIEELPRCEQAA